MWGRTAPWPRWGGWSWPWCSPSAMELARCWCCQGRAGGRWWVRPPLVEARSAPARPGWGQAKGGIRERVVFGARLVGRRRRPAPKRSRGRIPTTLAASARAVLRPSARHRPGRVGPTQSGRGPRAAAQRRGRSCPVGFVVAGCPTAQQARVRAGPDQLAGGFRSRAIGNARVAAVSRSPGRGGRTAGVGGASPAPPCPPDEAVANRSKSPRFPTGAIGVHGESRLDPSSSVPSPRDGGPLGWGRDPGGPLPHPPPAGWFAARRAG